MILFIDGSSLLSTCYYATLPKQMLFEKDEEKKKAMYGQIMQAPDGRYTNGIYGMMRMLLSLLKNQKPGHVAIAFDKSRDTFRRDIYPEYKTNRGATPAPLKEQFLTAEQMLEDCGFAIMYSDEYEADDLIGSLVAKTAGKAPIRLVTKDQDYFQLVDDAHDVRLWLYMPDRQKAENVNRMYRGAWAGFLGQQPFADAIPPSTAEFTEETAEDYYGARPVLVPDLKGLGGDSSDNIPGVRGVSAATASPLLKEYEGLEGIYEAIDNCGGNQKEEKELALFWKKALGISRSPIKALKEGRDAAFLSRKLATIKKDCPVPVDMDAMSTTGIRWKALDSWFAELGMHSLRNKLGPWQQDLGSYNGNLP